MSGSRATKVLRSLGAVTGKAELERDGPYATHGCLVPPYRTFGAGLLICLSGDEI